MSHEVITGGPTGATPLTQKRRDPPPVDGPRADADHQFMVILDVSVVNVALPSIRNALAFTSADYQWTVSAYVLLSGGLLLLGGRLADLLLDRRAMFLTGLGLFTTASWSAASRRRRRCWSSPVARRAPVQRCSRPRPCRSS